MTALRAFTLVELVTVILVISIIVAICTPNIILLLKKQEASRYHAGFKEAFLTARNATLTYHQPVSFCGSSNLQQLCDHRWDKGIAVFIDYNGNRVRDGNDQVIKFIANPIRYGRLKVKISLNQQVMKLSPDRGLPAGSFGSLIYCSDEPQLIRALIFSRMGVFRHSHDSNNDGIHDNNPDAIDCSD